MADAANQIFLPWVQPAIAANLPATSTDQLTANQPAAVTLAVALAVNAEPIPQKTVRLYGPGDVTGIDPHQVVRVEPRPQTVDFEPNYFPAIEFDRPDFPWLFTPAIAGPQGRLRPWLCLVVVRKQPGVELRPAGDLPQPVLVIQAPADPSVELPDLAESHLWAHAQLTGIDKSQMKTAIAADPARSISRLLCPRRLDPSTDYIACVVPTFEVGRKAGLNEPLQPNEEKKLQPAWVSSTAAPINPPTNAPAKVMLPVYYSWEFRTGVGEDFEALASLLKPRELPKEVGKQPLDISHPGFNLPATASAGAPGTILGLEGALQVVDQSADPWPDAVRLPFQTELARLLNTQWLVATQGSQDPLVSPPIYGCWQAALHQVVPGPTPPSSQPLRPLWLDELNLDPRYRAIAAMGTRVVQTQQEALMASAWEQLGAIQARNQRQRQAQLSLAVNTIYHTTAFSQFSEEAFLKIVAPAQTRMVVTTPTPNQLPNQPSVQTRLKQQLESAVPASVLSAPIRRIARPRGPINRQYTQVGIPGVQALVHLFNVPPPPQGLAPAALIRDIPPQPDIPPARPGEPAVSETPSPKSLPSQSLRSRPRDWEAPDPLDRLDPHPHPLPSGPSPTTEAPPTRVGEIAWLNNGTPAGAVLGGDDGWLWMSATPTSTIQRVHQSNFRNGIHQHYFYNATETLTPSTGERLFAYVWLEQGTGLSQVMLQWHTGNSWEHRAYWRRLGNDETSWGVEGTTSRYRMPDFPNIGGWVRLEVFAADVGLENKVIDGMAFTLVGGGASWGRAGKISRRLNRGVVTLDMVSDRLIIDGRFKWVRPTDPRLQPDWERALISTGRMGTLFRFKTLVNLNQYPATHINSHDEFYAAAKVHQAYLRQIFQMLYAVARQVFTSTAAVKTAVLTSLEPSQTVRAAVSSYFATAHATNSARLQFSTDPLAPIVEAPVFPQPMYEALRDLSQDYLFPGLEQVPPNTVQLLQTNAKFIEAFMVGLNAEMSRELLWRDYPTDQRGTYFQQFWDVLATSAAPNLIQPDILPIDQWGNHRLGESAIGVAAGGNKLVLLLRGELLRRYPNTVIYAVKAVKAVSQGSERDLSSNPQDQAHPQFRGSLDPDVTFVGFALTPAEVVAGLGWYFVLQQQPTEPRFGLDAAPFAVGESGVVPPLQTWNDLNWGHLAPTAAALKTLSHVSVKQRQLQLSPPSTPQPIPPRTRGTWGYNSAHMAYITKQPPTRIAIHATELIR